MIYWHYLFLNQNIWKKKYYKAAAIGMIYRNITNKSNNKWSVFLGVIVKKRIYAFLCMRIFWCKLCLHLDGLSTRDVRCVLKPSAMTLFTIFEKLHWISFTLYKNQLSFPHNFKLTVILLGPIVKTVGWKLWMKLADIMVHTKQIH